MATRIQLSEAQATEAMWQAMEAARKYNDDHDETRMVVRQLPGGNVQIIVEKVEPFLGGEETEE